MIASTFGVQFRPGDIVRIKDTAVRSRSGRHNKGLITTIVRIYTMAGEPYAMLDMPDCGGVWLHELEHAGLLEDDWEYL